MDKYMEGEVLYYKEQTKQTCYIPSLWLGDLM